MKSNCAGRALILGLPYLLFLTLTFTVRCQAAPNLAKAEALLQQGELLGAKKEVEDLLKKRPTSSEALVFLANLLLLEDDFFENAGQSVGRALKITPHNAKALATYGHCLFREGDFAAAEVQFRKSLQSDAKEASAYLGLGRLFLTRLKPTEGLESLQKAIQLAPELEDGYFFAGEAYGTTKNVTLQIQHLEKYLALKPKFRPERVQNAQALLKFFRSFEQEQVAHIKDASRSYELPFQPFFGLMLVEGHVNSEGPYRFLVDSGATSTVLSNALLDRLKIPSIATAVVKCVGGTGKSTTRLCKVGKLRIGELEVSNVPVASFDNTIFGGLIDGVLSTADLAEFIITLDYPERTILLNPRPPSDRTPSSDVTNNARTNSEFRVLGNLILLPVSINGHSPKSFLFDTGAVTSTLSKKQAALLGVNEDTADASVDLQFAGACGVTQSVLSVNGVNLGLQTMKQEYAKILAVELKEISKEIQTEISGILGGDFYSKYKVTIDYYRTKLTIE